MNKRLLNIVSLFWFLKFIFDMFYTQKYLTVIIAIFAVILLLFSIKKIKINFKFIDFLVILMIVLFSLSFLKSPEYYLDYLKILSAFILYFLGRFLYNDEEKIEKTVLLSLFIVFVVNLIVCLIGKGSVKWGNAVTLNGMYYFKTDFACMLTYFLIFWLINYNKNILIKITIILITFVLILLANARIYYLISAIVIVMYLFFKKSKKIFSLKTMLSLSIFIIIVIFGIQLMSNLTFFQNRNLISININSFDDLLNASNTQGRNVVWENLINNFIKQDLTTRIFGAGLSFYKEYGYLGFSEHSTYIKVLLNTGYFGLFVFIMFVLCSFKSISNISNIKIEYISFLLFITFLISGLSSPTITFVNTSWLPMFYCGICSSYKNKISNY